MDALFTAQLAELAKNGILGSLLILCLWRIFTLEKRNSTLMQGRLEDYKEIGVILTQNSVVMSNWTTSNDVRTRALESSARAQELSNNTLVNLAGEINRLNTTNERSAQEIQRLREALMQKGFQG